MKREKSWARIPGPWGVKEFYSRFSISRHQTAVKVFEVLSVAMTSSPEVVRIKKLSSIFQVFGPTEFISKQVYGLRLAELSSPYPKGCKNFTKPIPQLEIKWGSFYQSYKCSSCWAVWRFENFQIPFLILFEILWYTIFGLSKPRDCWQRTGNAR